MKRLALAILIALGISYALAQTVGPPIIPPGSVPGFPVQTANKVFASPSGSSGVPSFRTLANSDLTSATGTGVPTALNVTTNASGGVALANGTITPGNCLQWSASGVSDAGSGCAGPTPGFRNRLINGGMDIDQRNNGATGTGTFVYTVDRWQYGGTQASKGTWERNLNSVTAPSGFGNYLGFQSSSAYSVVSTDYFEFNQPIEAYNTVDFAFGTASARTVTLSFWAYSSLTGNFGASVSNYAGTRSYCFSYNIPSANTWTYITVTIPGDTGGTWALTGPNGSMVVRFGLGAGSGFTTTANVWVSGNYIQPNSTVSVVGSNSATFYVTGVQLELGAAATPFDRRAIGIETALCQRYYQVYLNTTGATGSLGVIGGAQGSNQIFGNMLPLNAPMRTVPTAAVVGSWIGINAYGATLLPNLNSVFLSATSSAAGYCQVYAPTNGGFSLSAEL